MMTPPKEQMEKALWPMGNAEFAALDDDTDERECARCAQPFRSIWGDERVCERCYYAENGPRW